MTDGQRPRDLDEHDLGAHSAHRFRLYGSERLWVPDIRSASVSDADIDVRLKNITLSASLPVMERFSFALSQLLFDVRTAVELWPEVPGQRSRRGVGREPLRSPFERHLGLAD